MTDDERAWLMAVDMRTIVALTIYGEARGEPIEGKIGVGAVIRNRVRTQYQGRTYHTVCLAPRQFSCWNDGDPNREELLNLSANQKADEANVVWRECRFVALGIVTDQLRDMTHGARHYHARGVTPGWAVDRTPSAHVGRHVFYAGIA